MFNFTLTLFYLMIIFIIGLVASRKVNNVSDYIIGNVNYSIAKIISTILIIIIGTVTSLNLAEKDYKISLLTIFIAFGFVINKLITGKFLAEKIYDCRDLLSVGGIMEKFYGFEGRVFSGIISLFYCLIIFAIQALMITNLFHYIFSSSSIIMSLTCLSSIIIYSSLGGIRATMATGFTQFIILVIAIAIIFSIGIGFFINNDFFLETVATSNFDILNSKKYFKIFIMLAFLFLDPSVIQKIFICNSRKQTVNTFYITGIIIISLLIITVLSGVVSFFFFPSFHLNSIIHNIINKIALKYDYVFISGLLAIIISTAENKLSLANVALVNDIILPLLPNKITSKMHLKLLRISGIMIGIMMCIIVFSVHLKYELLYYAYKLWMPTILVPLILGLYNIKISKRAFLISCILSLTTILTADYFIKSYYSYISIIPAIAVQLLYLCYSYSYNISKKPSEIIRFFIINIINQQMKLWIKIRIFICKFFTKSIIDRLVKFSNERVELHGAYYISFGILGTINYFIPYFIWTHKNINDSLILIFRLISSFLCFILILKYQRQHLANNSKSKTLPLYWHFTLLFCLPFVSTYCLLISGFETIWLINFTLSMFIMVLLVDWITFTILLSIGFILGYLVYIIKTGHLKIFFIKENLYLTIYLNCFTLLLGVFFLYHKEQMIKAVIEAKNNLEKMNAELEEKVRDKTNDLKQSLTAKTDFLNNLSHEVRTPLQGITGISSELVERWHLLKEDTRFEYVKAVASNSSRLVSLVSNLLDLSKFDSGKMLYNKEVIDLKEVLKEVIYDLKIFNVKKDVEIILNDSLIETKVYVDRDRIAQVIRNLLSNALKFTEKGNITICLDQLDIKNWNQFYSTGILVSIKDCGLGIPESELDSIFQPFTQSSRTKTKTGGTGLGLAISAEIIHAHNGKIWAVNNKNGGATFSFIIPSDLNLSDNKPNDKEENANEEVDLIDTISKLINKKVLLIDDEPSCLISGTLILQSAGFEVVTASGGVAALKLLNEQDFSLVLLDLMMPDIYGLDVLEEMRKSERLHKIPVILQTGASDNAEINKAFSLGISAYISKPYNKIAMKKIINDALKKLQE